jgi:hypothetical protein
MAEGASPELLRELLREWEAELRGVGFPIDRVTNPGVDPAITREAFRAAGLRAPEELQVWFAWRNGQPFQVPGLAGFREMHDLENSLSRRLDPDFWDPRWVRLAQADPGITMNTADVTPAPLLRATVFEIGTDPEPSHSDVRSLCTLVTWFIGALRSGEHRWDRETAAWAPRPITGVFDLPRMCYL